MPFIVLDALPFRNDQQSIESST